MVCRREEHSGRGEQHSLRRRAGRSQWLNGDSQREAQVVSQGGGRQGQVMRAACGHGGDLFDSEIQGVM